MLSRRNIRIKIMQLLFALNRDETLSSSKTLDSYEDFIYQSYKLYLFHLYLLIDIIQYAKTDSEKRKSKYLPIPEDLSFSPVLLENECSQNLVLNKSLQNEFKKSKFSEKWDTDISKKVYFEFAKTPEYLEYVFGDLSKEKHIDTLLSIYKFAVKHELCEELIEDLFSNWQDDRSLIIGAVKKSIKSLPADEKFYEYYLPEDETLNEFGLALINETLERDEEIISLVEPVLNNWEVDRVAVIDLILIKMAVAEMIKFPSIPLVVTINEYVEISKSYSTEKSKEFVNGILDKLTNVLRDKQLLDKPM
jgi:N utilization substance protein B